MSMTVIDFMNMVQAHFPEGEVDTIDGELVIRTGLGQVVVEEGEEPYLAPLSGNDPTKVIDFISHPKVLAAWDKGE